MVEAVKQVLTLAAATIWNSYQGSQFTWPRSTRHLGHWRAGAEFRTAVHKYWI